MLIYSKNKLEIEQLKKLKTPKGTNTHTPIPHSLLVDYTRKALDSAGIEVTEEEHGIARGGLRYFGGFALTGKGLSAKSRSLVLGLRNAHDKAFAASVCIGNKMIVCENLCFSSDIKLARRHTTHILEDLPRVLSTAVSRFTTHWADMGKRIKVYKETELEPNRVPDLLCQLVDAKAFPARDIYKTVKEFQAPRHAEFKGDTLWNLYNACTEHLKNSDLSKLPARTMTIQSVFDGLAGHESKVQTIDV
jgi:hypothetical protein